MAQIVNDGRSNEVDLTGLNYFNGLFTLRYLLLTGTHFSEF